MGLVHMPAGEDARLHAKRADEPGVAFEIYHLCFVFARKSQILSGDVHEDGEPLPASCMPEHLKVGIPECVPIIRFIILTQKRPYDNTSDCP